MLLVGSVLFLAYWAIFGKLSQISMLVIVFAALILSPRFEIVEKQSGPKLQMKGFPVMFMKWVKGLSSKNK